MPKVPYSDNVVPLRPAPPDPQSLMLAAGMMYNEGRLFQPVSEQIPDMPIGPGADTWEKIIPRKGRSDADVLKEVPEDMEAFTLGGHKDRIMLRKIKKAPASPRDLVS